MKTMPRCEASIQNELQNNGREPSAAHTKYRANYPQRMAAFFPESPWNR